MCNVISTNQFVCNKKSTIVHKVLTSVHQSKCFLCGHKQIKIPICRQFPHIFGINSSEIVNSGPPEIKNAPYGVFFISVGVVVWTKRSQSAIAGFGASVDENEPFGEV